MLPTATNVWLEKAEYVHALYPPNCTDDTEIVAGVGEIIRSQSVLGQPTRFTTLDLEYGRSGEHVFIKQPRRRAPGWDGCRDRLDGRLDLPVALQWLRPSQRAGHRSVYSPKHRLMLVYGGEANVLEQQQAFDITHATHTVGDLWQHHLGTRLRTLLGAAIRSLSVHHRSLPTKLLQSRAVFPRLLLLRRRLLRHRLF